jgi:8-oxo-dGTP pyrophosphatase MutT (NUDIX family)
MSPEVIFGVVPHQEAKRRTDFLYRISLKCLVINQKGEVLVVKESGRDWWDLPGGGMDHGESIKSAITREVKEEVGLHGDFNYRIIAVEEPALLRPQNFWQMRLIFAVTPHSFALQPADDGDEVAFIDPHVFKKSANKTERLIYDYSRLL